MKRRRYGLASATTLRGRSKRRRPVVRIRSAGPVFAAGPTTRFPTIAGSVRTRALAVTAVELRQIHQSKRKTPFALQSGGGVHHDIHGIKGDTEAHFAVAGRSGQCRRASQKLVDEAVGDLACDRARRCVARKRDPNVCIDARPTSVGAALAVLRCVFWPTVLHTPGAGTLESASAA